MRYVSVCSGIEAATVAWHPLGFKAAAFAEVDKAASAVLKHHYPDTPNVGDFTKIKGDEYGAIDILKLLLDAGGDASVRDHSHGRTPLIAATFFRETKTAELLIQHGVDLDELDSDDGCPALMWATRNGLEDTALRLIEAGANPRFVERDGTSILHVAALQGQMSVLKRLISMKVDVNVRDKEGYTPLFYAKKHGQNACVESLLDNGATL